MTARVLADSVPANNW